MNSGSLILCGVLSVSFVVGCSKDDASTPVDNAPAVSRFTASPTSIKEGGIVGFTLEASDDNGLARAILDYDDGSKRDTIPMTGNSMLITKNHQYLAPGSFNARGRVQDGVGQQAEKIVLVGVDVNDPPQIKLNQLAGAESKLSKASITGMATDAEGDPFKLSFSSLSSDMIVQVVGDSLRYSLNDPNASGSRQLRVRADYEKNGSSLFVEKVVPVVFAPLDDITGTVVDYYLNSFLSTVNPLVVMQGPYSGFVDIITGTDSVRAFLDAAGNFKAPKVANMAHVLKAFMTNGSDSSYVATLNLSAGDQPALTPKVFTNAGTDGAGRIPLATYRNSLLKVANFDLTFANKQGILYGMDLKNHASDIVIYLSGKDTTDFTLGNVYGWTPEQQTFLEDHINNVILKYLPPANRPRIVKGLPTDALPVHEKISNGISIMVPNKNYVVIFTSHSGNPGQILPFDDNRDGIFEGSFILVRSASQVTLPPYGMDIYSLNQECLSAFVGYGSVLDRTLDGKTCLLEGPTYPAPVNLPSGDQKFISLFVSEVPGVNNSIESRLFGLPR